MPLVSPLPEPDKTGFLDTLRTAASDIWSNLKKKITTPFGQTTRTRVMFDEEPTPTPTATPTPTPTPTPTEAPIPTPTLRPDIPQHDYGDLLAQYFPENEINNAQNVIMGESSFDSQARNENENGTIDLGLFQINSGTFDDFMARKPQLLQQAGIVSYEDMLDPIKNFAMARIIWDEQGWGAWVAAQGLGLAQANNLTNI